MRLILFAAVIVIVVASFYFDYRWKRWVAEQRESRERSGEDVRR